MSRQVPPTVSVPPGKHARKRQAKRKLDAVHGALADIAGRIDGHTGRAHGDEIHHVVEPVVEQAHAQRRVARETQIAFDLRRPFRLRPQIRIAAVDDVVGETGGGNEVGEIELAHIAEHAHLQLVLAKLSRELHARLHVGQ